MSNQQYQVLIKGNFKKEQIVYKLLSGKKSYSDFIQMLIDSAWESALNKGVKLYNGTCYSLIKAELVEDKIYCFIQESDYKSLYGTNISNISQIEDYSEMANCLAACIVIETFDKKIVLGKRSRHLAENVAQWHVIGGTVEIREASAEHPFDLMYKEIREELGIEAEMIQDMQCMGLVVPKHNNKPEFLFSGKCLLSSEAIRSLYEKAFDKEEHEYLEFIDLSEIEDFIKDKNFSSVGKAALEFKLGKNR